MYQKLIIAGHLGYDPELKFTKDGTAVTNFSVATNREWSGADGIKHKETVWFRVTAWQRLAEVCNEHLSKGSPVLLEGRLKPDENGNPRIWTDKNDNTRASFEIVAGMVKFLGGRGDNEGSPSRLPAADEAEASIPF